MSLRDTCHAFGPDVPPTTHDGQPVDGARLLWALAGVESSYGAQRDFARIEPSYQPCGATYRRSEAMRDLWRQYGALAACSYGSWQMMAITARELGHTGHPCELQHDEALAPLVIKYLQRAHANTLADTLDAYNSGSCRDKIIPEAYIRTGVAAYVAGWDRGPK